MSMAFSHEYVELFSSHNSPKVQYRMVVGFNIGNALYYFRQFGVGCPKSMEPEKAMEFAIMAAKRGYEQLESEGELHFDLRAYDFGVYAARNEDGEVIGDWPVIADLVVHYEEKFLMKGAELPEGYRHLQLLSVMNSIL